MPGAAAARSVARSVGSADSIHSTYLFAQRASSGDVAVPRPTAAAAPHRRRRCYLPQRSRRPPSPSPSPLPSFLRLSVSRSFLRGNWMTQKASQVSAARRCGDATRRAGRQISCSPPNATPQRDRDVQDQTVEQSANWTAKTRANPGALIGFRAGGLVGGPIPNSCTAMQ